MSKGEDRKKRNKGRGKGAYGRSIVLTMERKVMWKQGEVIVKNKHKEGEKQEEKYKRKEGENCKDC